MHVAVVVQVQIDHDAPFEAYIPGHFSTDEQFERKPTDGFILHEGVDPREESTRIY